MIRQLLRDPLAHFLVAGAIIWGVVAWRGEPVDPAERTIVVSRERQAGIALGFERMMGRAPTDAELDTAIGRWVREEVLYREALRLGLDQDDSVVRRRLATKMDELAGAEAEAVPASEAVLKRWRTTHAADYAEGGALTFEQAYFPTEEAARAALASGDRQGRPISLPRRLEARPPAEVTAQFGRQFSAGLAQLAPGAQWQGPVPSGFGWHLVRLDAREAGRVPPLPAIRERVESDWRSATVAERRQRAYGLLRDVYRVEIE